jgi:DNA segregation ATPase FtsK/SpoIIIE-like protein
MLQAPTTESKEQSGASRRAAAPEPQRTLHPRYGGIGGLDSAAAGEVESGPAGLRRRFAGLQKAIGNQAVLRMLSRSAPAIQTKLTVNQPGDKYEQEADRVAEQVMRMPDTGFSPKVSSTSGEALHLQRKCACGGSGGECEACKEKREEGPLQRKTQGTAGIETVTPPIVHEVLRSPGQPLDPATRSFMEPRFGHDFSHVRVHADSEAAESASAVDALAFTLGQHIVFGDGTYSPGTRAGQQLLAHELTHTVQQHAGTRAPQRNISPGPRVSHSHAEADSERNGRELTSVEQKRINLAAPLQIARNEDPGSKAKQGATPSASNAYAWNGGYWGLQVGFYGGVNYGYGYGGVGYQGGYWNNGAFNYNRSVNNVNVTNIHNVYNKTVINNTPLNHVSYNGGAGGIAARPTQEEEAAARQEHRPPTALQTQHVQAASTNHALLASVNQGRPAVAATSKPGELTGKGMVAAKQAGAPYKAAATENKAAANKAAATRTNENKAAENKATENRAAANKAAATRTNENKAAENKATENKAAANKAAATRTNENEAAENKATENRAAANKAAATRTNENKAANPPVARAPTETRTAPQQQQHAQPQQQQQRAQAQPQQHAQPQQQQRAQAQPQQHAQPQQQQRVQAQPQRAAPEEKKN